jgi:ankyrin repeat protein
MKETPLHYAVKLSSNSEIVRLLLFNGAEVDARDAVRDFTSLFASHERNYMLLQGGRGSWVK